MISFLVWTFLIYGLVTIIVHSDLLDWYRNWTLKHAGYPRVGTIYQVTQPIPPNKNMLPFFALFKVINCYICCSFWSGVVVSLLFDFGPMTNPFLSGIIAIGVTALYWNFRNNSQGE